MPAKMNRLIIVLQGVTLLALIAVPFGIVWIVLSPTGHDALLAALPSGTSLPIRLDLQVGLALTGIIPALVIAWALVSIWRLLRRYRLGDIYGSATALHIKRAGQALLAFAVLRVLTSPLQSLLLTMENPPGARAITLNISHTELALVLAGGLLLLVGWVTGQARGLAEDNAGFV